MSEEQISEEQTNEITGETTSETTVEAAAAATTETSGWFDTAIEQVKNDTTLVAKMIDLKDELCKFAKDEAIAIIERIKAGDLQIAYAAICERLTNEELLEKLRQTHAKLQALNEAQYRRIEQAKEIGWGVLSIFAKLALVGVCL